MQNRIKDIKVTVDLAAEPLSLTEVKEYLDIDYANHDTMLTTMIVAARKRLEKYTGRSFGAKTVKSIIDIYCDQPLPYGPVNAVTAALREGAADTGYTLAGDEFQPDYGGEWEITYTTNGTLPEDLKEALMAEVAYRYENRGDDNVTTLSTAAKELARPYKNYSWV